MHVEVKEHAADASRVSSQGWVCVCVCARIVNQVPVTFSSIFPQSVYLSPAPAEAAHINHRLALNANARMDFCQIVSAAQIERIYICSLFFLFYLKTLSKSITGNGQC